VHDLQASRKGQRTTTDCSEMPTDIEDLERIAHSSWAHFMTAPTLRPTKADA